MTAELILRREDPPQDAVILIRFGAGTGAADHLIRNSLHNYGLYQPVLRELGREGAGALTLSAYAVTQGVTIDALLRGPGARRPFYGVAAASEIRAAGFELWPTSPLVGGRVTPYSEAHFDIPVRIVDADLDEAAPSYRALSRGERRKMRARLSEPFRVLLELFEPHRPNPYAL